MVFCKNCLMFITGVVMAAIVYSSHHQLLLVTALSTLYRRTCVTCFFILFFLCWPLYIRTSKGTACGYVTNKWGNCLKVFQKFDGALTWQVVVTKQLNI